VNERPHCLVIDGHPLVRVGLRGALGDGFEVQEADSREEALGLVRDIGDFDVAVVDMRAWANGDEPSISGPDAIRSLRRTEPSLGIVAHGERAERHLATAALQAGATAYVSRTSAPEEVQRAVKAAVDQSDFVDPAVPPKGSRGILTGRQRQILQLLADGESTAAIAAGELALSEETVKTHAKNILTRLGARNRAHAVAIGIRAALIE